MRASLVLFLWWGKASSFHPPHVGVAKPSALVDQSSSSSNEDPRATPTTATSGTSERLFLERFRRQKVAVTQTVEREFARRPPNAALDARQTVTEILEGLRQPHYPQRDFGLRVLLRASAPRWRTVLCQAVGAPVVPSAADEKLTEETTLAAALEAAMGRPNNQFRILLGLENEGYITEFPTDTLDYGDGTCWLECRLRDPDTHELLVALGWSLQRNATSQAWMIEALDWQDFRASYRPGIGREEWERICG